MFTRFNYRQTFHEARKKRKRQIEQSKPFESEVGVALSQLLTSLMNISNEDDTKNKQKRKAATLEELPGVKS